MCVPTPPSKAVLISPYNGERIISLSTTLDWSDVSWGAACPANSTRVYGIYVLDEERYLNHAAYFGGRIFPSFTDRAQYTMYANTDDPVSQVAFNQNTVNPGQTIEYGERYYWVVVAFNGAGGGASTSNTASFYTPTCGDGICAGYESCSSCPQDCGPCPNAWWQTWGGHVYSAMTSGEAINSLISATCLEPNCVTLIKRDRVNTANSDGFPITGGGGIAVNGQAITYRYPDVSVTGTNVTRFTEKLRLLCQAVWFGRKSHN